jgi:alkaline phosphatase D
MKLSKYSRRRFLQQSVGIASALVAGLGSAQAQERDGFSHSPAAFDAGSRSVLIWVRGRSDGQAVQVEWDRADNFASSTLTQPAQLAKDRDLTHTFELNNLEPDSVYFYRPVSSAGGRQLVGDIGQFRTAPEASRAFTFAVSADVLASYKPFRLFDAMLARKPEFFIHLGDMIYADHPNPRSFSGSLALYRSKHAENRDDARMQKFMAATPTFAMWDDHEVQDNFDRTHPLLAEGRQAFMEWWPRRASVAFQLYRRFSWGPLVDFFLLDTRQYRSPANAPDDADKTMLGAEQKAWLKDGLKNSKAPLKILLSPSPFNSKTDRDSWGGYPGERKELDDFIEQNKVYRVFVISGDWHMAIDISRTASAIDEVVVGPIAAWPQFQMEPKTRRLLANTKIPHLGDAFNFGYGRIEPTPTGARLTLDIVDLDGNVRFSKIVES